MSTPKRLALVLGASTLLASGTGAAQGTVDVTPPEHIEFREPFVDRGGTVIDANVAPPDSIVFRPLFLDRGGNVVQSDVAPPARLVFREPLVGRDTTPLVQQVEPPSGLEFRDVIVSRDGAVLDENVPPPSGLVFRDVFIGRGGIPTGADPAPPIRIIEDARAVPNPFNPSTQVSFRLRKSGPTSIAIYDSRGRLVRVLHDGPLVADAHVMRWDGRDDEGTPVASGLYLVRIASGGEAVVVKGILIE